MNNNFNYFLIDRFGKNIYFNKNQTFFGRKDCDIILKSTSVDYKHCAICFNDNDNLMRIKDFRTSNGTFVNDKPIEVDQFILLHVGDKIRLAYDQITFTVSKKLENTNLQLAPVAHSSPSRGSDYPCALSEPEKLMPSILCDLNDSIIDLKLSDNFSNEEDEEEELVTSNNDYETFEETEIKHELKEAEEQQENITDDIPTKFEPPIYFSKVSETFVVDFDEDDNIEVDKISIGVNRFVPSKLRASFEEREKAKRTKIQPLKTSNKVENSLTKISKPSRFGKVNNKLSTVSSQSSSKTTANVTSKNDNKIPAKSKILSNITKVVEKPSKHKPLLNQRKQSSESKESLEKVKSLPTSKISTPTLSKRNSKSNVLEKLCIDDQRSNKRIEKGLPLTSTKLVIQDSTIKKSYTLNKMLSEDSKSRKNELVMKFQQSKVISSTANRNNPKSYAIDKKCFIEDECIDRRSERYNKTQLFQSSKTTFPTHDKRNSKSYLLEKMLMGENSSHDFLTYDETTLIKEDSGVNVESTDLIIDSEIKGSMGNLSEAGTYIIENNVDGKTVNLEDSDHTLGNDDSSSMSSLRIDSHMELESKSSGKWLSEFPTDDITMNCENKSKRIINSKFTGSSMPHIPNDEYFSSNKRDNFREDEHCKPNYNGLVTDNRHRGNRNSNSRSVDEDNNNKRNSTLETQQQYDSNIQNAYSSYSNIPYTMGIQSIVAAEDFYVPDDTSNFTVPSNICNQALNLPQNVKDLDNFSHNKISIKRNPRSTFSVASLDTALLLQDTEALLNDMEKRVYSRKDKKDEMSKSQCFTTNMSHGEKIPFVDEADEKEEDSSLFSYQDEVDDNSRISSIKPPQPISYIDSISAEDKNRSYTVRSPINSGSIRRNNSCKLGISESMTISRKLNSSIRNQRSCSMIEEKRLNNLSNNNNNNESFIDYRSKSKPSVLAMNSGIYMNRRGSAGISSALNSPVSRLEPGSFFNNSFSVQRSKDVFPYFSTNMLSLHRQRFNRYEYGQHSLKYNSNSTTMLYNKYNNTSPPWNGEDTIVSPNSFYPTYDTVDYYPYKTVPESFDASILLSKHEHHNANINSQVHASNLELNPETDFNKREEMGEFSQPCNASGRSSAFSPVNSLHQSTESVNNYQMASKSRSSIGLNEQKNCNYDILLVSSVHQYSARLCRYTEEIVHRMSRREGCEYQGNSPDDTVYDQSDSFGQLKSVNRELQETVSNLRSLEKQLQKVERFIFPIEKSGRNSTAGSCSEDNYLNQLERINKELKDFVPINDPISKVSSAKLTVRGEYSYLSGAPDVKEISQVNFKPIPSKEKVTSKSHNYETQMEQSKVIYNNSVEVRSTPKSKYSSISKRFQHRKD